MNSKELASKLSGREYRKEITEEEERQAKADGLVVLFGGSDDLMEFRGSVNDEVSCYEGGVAYLTSAGLFQTECDNDACPHEKRLRNEAVPISAIWDRDGYSWVYETMIPHEVFDIMEGGEKYCRGIVFSLRDV